MSARRRIGLVFGVAIVTLLASVAATHARQAKKKADKPDYKLVIYDDEQNRGKSIVIRKTVADLEALKFNDKSESLKWNLAPGTAAVLFDEKNFARPVLILVGEGEVLDLGKEQPNALHCVTSVTFVPCKKGARPKGVSRDIAKVGTEE